MVPLQTTYEDTQMTDKQRMEIYNSAVAKLCKLTQEAGNDLILQREVYSFTGGLAELTRAELLAIQQQITSELLHRECE